MDIAVDRDRRAVPGFAIGVMADGVTRYGCDGETSIDNPLPVTPQTLFQLGSVTKLVTATALLALVDRGMLAVGDLVTVHLRDLDLGGAGETLNIEHLLTHRGGWLGDWSLFNAPSSHDVSALSEMVRRAPEVPRFDAPGGPFSYDNFGWCVAGLLIEQTVGSPFDHAVHELVLEPLGLRDSVFWADDAIWKRASVGHTAGGAHLAIGTEPWADVWPVRRALWPQGGLVASVADALEFASFHATGATSFSGGQRPLSDDVRLEMQTPRAPSGGQGSEVALGWHVRYASGVPVLSHTGAGQGFFAQAVAVPTRHSAMVALTNSASGPEQVGRAFGWYLTEVLHLTPDQPALGPAPPDRDRSWATTSR